MAGVEGTAEDRRCLVCDAGPPFPMLFEQESFRLVRCPACRLVFQDPQPAEEVLDAAYYHDPEFALALLGPLRLLTLERAREKLPLLRAAGGLREGARVLDVGCSSGAWLEVAQAEGLTATGVELGRETAAQARRRGLDVRTGTLADAFPELAAGRFDLITFWDVLEHLRDPRRELAAALELLAPGGLLAATLPNVEGLYPRVTYRLIASRTGFWEYPEPVHLYDFSPRTSTRLLKRAGFEVTRIRTLATPFFFYRQTTLSAAQLGGGLSARALRLAFEALRLPVYPLARLLDRGNSMFVVAQAAARGLEDSGR